MPYIFPITSDRGAASDEELAYQVGLITADEAKLCHMLWNYSPCVAQSVDPRWGRTYESYGSDLDTIIKLSTAYTKGMIDGGLVVCAKHFFADGNMRWDLKASLQVTGNPYSIPRLCPIQNRSSPALMPVSIC